MVHSKASREKSWHILRNRLFLSSWFIVAYFSGIGDFLCAIGMGWVESGMARFFRTWGFFTRQAGVGFREVEVMSHVFFKKMLIGC